MECYGVPDLLLKGMHVKRYLNNQNECFEKRFQQTTLSCQIQVLYQATS